VIIPTLMNYLNEQANLKGDTIHPLTEAEKEYNLVSLVQLNQTE
jgi:hypothetical protein